MLFVEFMKIQFLRCNKVIYLIIGRTTQWNVIITLFLITCAKSKQSRGEEMIQTTKILVIPCNQDMFNSMTVLRHDGRHLHGLGAGMERRIIRRSMYYRSNSL